MENKHAGFWVRLIAYLIDSVVTIVIALIMIIGGIAMLGGNATPESVKVMSNIVSILNFIIILGYWSITQSSSWQATIGKKVMGLKLVNQDGTRVSFMKALGRSTIGYLISGIVIYIGFIAIGVTKEKVGFHDMIFKTYVVYA
jgi:uncharacterized RDD family membrane protein YckC